MGKWIKIKKIKENKEIYYSISDPTINKNVFFMGIDPKTQCINIYKDKECFNKLLIVDLKNKEKSIDIGNLNPRLFWPAILQASKAIENNNFPDDISYIA